jgi:shikimate kinase
MKKIILLGYMGCGKSTIAKALSKTIKVPFVDLDISKKKRIIRAIFEMKGEIKFRKMEHEALWNYAPWDAIMVLGRNSLLCQ